MHRGPLALTVALLLATAATGASAAASDFDNPASSDTSQQFTTRGNVQRQDTPNDPDYDRAEDPRNETTNLYDERFDLFGFPSKHTPLAIYKDGPNALKPMVAGFNAAGAWKQERGRSEVFVAILDTGIKWDRAGLRTQVRLNAGELPLPQNAAGETQPDHDFNGNGVLDVDDYAEDPRVGKARPTGQDLIRAFSNGVDEDGNGYVDDIAGWDFFDDDNDPYDASSYFAASNHGSGRAAEAVERGNDGHGSIGVCPRCQFLPLRTWDTFVSDANTFAMGIVYATDMGASVIEGANGSLYHSAFAEAASEYAYRHGVAQVFSGDDLNTGNHNYPANYSHTMLIQGTVADTYGLGTDFGPEAAKFLGALGLPLGTEVPTLTLFRGAGTTQYGGHSSVSMVGATGSENTGKAAGAAALVKSAGLSHPAGPINLNADEIREILEGTAEDVTPLNTQGIGLPDRAVVGWDPHFGWGRVNLGAAVARARSGQIPPEAAIWTPDWFAPVTGDKVRITGRARVRLRPGQSFRWVLEWGVGETPTSWRTAGEGVATTEVNDFGAIDMDAVRAALRGYRAPVDAGGPAFAPGGPTPFDREWTVRLRVSTQGLPDGVDRRVLAAPDDPATRPGFPKRLGAGGEAAIRYADLDGDNVQELVVPLEDGTVHAYRRDGSELPGWPVRTDLMKQARAHMQSPGMRAIDALPLEPPRAPLIADLDGDGRPEVITTAGRQIYAWQADGTRRAGFPVGIDPALCRAEDQSQPLRHRKCGFFAAPAIAHLEGRDEPPAIVAPALDGHLYAVRPDGGAVPGYPVELVDPDIAEDERMRAESINQPAVADLDGDGRDDVVVATNETYGAEPPSGDSISGLLAQALTDLLANAAGGAARVYAVNGASGRYLPGWPVKVNGAIQTTLPLIGPGHDPAIAKVGGERRVVVSATGSTTIEQRAPDGSTQPGNAQQALYGPLSDATDRLGALNLFESAIVADVLGTGGRAIVKYGVTISQAANLLLVGQNLPYNHLIGAYDAQTGLPLPAFPRVTDDYQFLSSSIVAKVDPASPANQVLAGTGLGLLHAYDGLTGRDAPGFPKVTGGWLYAPAALSDDGRMAAITREGHLFEWTTSAPACQPEGTWTSFRHDDQGTGNLDADGTAPGAVRDLLVEHVTGDTYRVSFTAPGDDRMCGAASAFEARVDGAPVAVDLGTPPAGGRKVSREVRLAGAGTLEVLARDDAGNRGFPARAAFAPRAAATPTPTPAPKPPPGAGKGCRDRLAPVSRFAPARARVKRGRVLLRGRSADRGPCGARVRAVQVAVQRTVRGGRAGRPLRADGRLGRPRACGRINWLRARGTRAWSFRTARPLPRGSYTAWVRGADPAGNVERRARGRNMLRFRVR